MLAKDAPQLYTQRAMDTILADTRTALREYQSSEEDAVHVELKVQDHLYQVRKATEAAGLALAAAPLDTVAPLDAVTQAVPQTWGGGAAFENCENELHPDPEQTAFTTKSSLPAAFPELKAANAASSARRRPN